MKILKEAQENSCQDQRELAMRVSEIISEVRNRGDKALFDFNKIFEGNTRQTLRVSEFEIEEAYSRIEAPFLAALKLARTNLQRFAEAQKKTLCDLAEHEVFPGVFAGHRVIPVNSCCCYVPGGEYPLFSSALMLAIPAKVAGVQRIVACSPAMKGTQNIAPATLVALDLAGVDEIYVTGGAQAIAAFAFGTKQIKPVDLIVGPGNRYVTEAKRQCFGPVGIDFVAGPSEVLIIADQYAQPAIIAADLLAQAEHDPQAISILITVSEELGREVLTEVNEQLTRLKTKNIAGQAWEKNGQILVVNNLERACEVANFYAPEHLELMVQDPERVLEQLTNYGSLFIGEMTAEVFGDYLSGPNHTLPTAQAARYTGGVWVGTFSKVCTHQRFSKKGFQSVAEPTKILAQAEGLDGHCQAVEIRRRILSLNPELRS